ncbi:recombinase RecQ [Arachidicoccus ginsenosidimutans]|uniref:RecQ family ATP-dependent DNA helicase n=1 Tax=Arachidicoccus sp. BS20 TaxID=1850526 RepID=UPI0007F0702D|nr:ATP-dependent DNA helicase RecQ [Arachidicoccus sp. BS20]ANI89168.1 recombinase RecQ [Arachidicoccus sp. BS20]
MPTPIDILKTYWGFSAFRGEQENIIRAVLQKKDVLALLPTGGGKSVCFQIPAMMSDGVCLIITPLIALMKDQAENLKNKGISACAIHSGLSNDEVSDELENAVRGDYKFLYISPERIDTSAFQRVVEVLNVNLIAVDEAHCISQWGYDFRPSYLRIVELKKYFPGVPMLALTASATPNVQKDIVEKLLFKNYEVFRSSFQRPNISYEVIFCDNKIDKLSKILLQQNGSAIVYCKTRRLTQDVSKLLRIKNIDADFYHAGLSQEIRDAKQQNWMQNKTRVIVCTNAFGMGIDKPDVRIVAHYDAPDCLENYYQEAGRAGRDGKAARAILLYQNRDIKDLKSLPDVRFPKFDEIKKAYQHLCDFLQIPIGIGEGNFYDFDFNTFIKNFKLDAVQTIYCIKALEQAGFISFNENIFLPSKVGFTIDKESLFDFENNYPAYEPLIKVLLRSYDSIFSYRVSVFEKQLARLLCISGEAVTQQLQALQRFGVLEYLPKKETPQIFFLTNRAPAEFLLFNHEDYLKRKKIFVNRVEKMLQYIHTNTCRSVFIAQYFGDENTQRCGVCDNCTESKNEKLSAKEFASITSEILHLLKQKSSLDTKGLINELNNFSSEKVKETLRYLRSERKIKMDVVGNFSLH